MQEILCRMSVSSWLTSHCWVWPVTPHFSSFASEIVPAIIVLSMSVWCVNTSHLKHLSSCQFIYHQELCPHHCSLQVSVMFNMASVLRFHHFSLKTLLGSCQSSASGIVPSIIAFSNSVWCFTCREYFGFITSHLKRWVLASSSTLGIVPASLFFPSQCDV